MSENEYLRDIDPEQWAEYQEEQKLDELEQAKLMDDFRAVGRTPEGIRVLRSILDRLGMFAPAFTGNSKTFYNLGKLEGAQDIFGVLTLADPRAAQQVLLEGYRRAARMKILKKEKVNG